MKIEIEISELAVSVLSGIAEARKRDLQFVVSESLESYVEQEIERASVLLSYLDSPTKRTVEKPKRPGFRKGMRSRVFEKSGGLCAYCGTDIKYGGNWHIDHVIPISRGGKDEFENFAASCPTCNINKGDKTLSEFLEASRK